MVFIGLLLLGCSLVVSLKLGKFLTYCDMLPPGPSDYDGTREIPENQAPAQAQIELKTSTI